MAHDAALTCRSLAQDRHDRSAHDHGHAHEHRRGDSAGHDHVHAPASFGRAFAVGVLLNTAFVGIEAVYGALAHSVALLADAGHNLSDVLGLAAAWAASELAKRPAAGRFTYGLRASTILAALGNSVLLLLATGAIALEAVQRLLRPEPVQAGMVMAVAAAGIVVNGFTAALFARGRRGDLNVRAAFLHMAGDAVIAAGVVVAGAVIALTGWLRLDPLVSLGLAGFIAWSSWGVLRDAAAMSLQAAPAGVPPAEVGRFLRDRPGVQEVHDLHVWCTSTTEVALTAHLVMPAGHPGDAALAETARLLEHRFGVGHATLQVETGGRAACPLRPLEAI